MEYDDIINDHCENLHASKPYCISTGYTIVFDYRKEFRSDIYALPTTRQTSFVFIPKMSLLDLSLLIAEAFDIWLGISFALLCREINSLAHCNFNE